jgi:hypothetical protein
MGDVPAGLTRRQAIEDLGAAPLGVGALGGGLGELVARAAAAGPRTGSLKDVEHITQLDSSGRKVTPST